MISVGIFPVKSSLAMGQPPKPFSAPSNRRHPALKAAETSDCAFSGRVCKCAPISTVGNAGIISLNNDSTSAGLAAPMVSESA